MQATNHFDLGRWTDYVRGIPADDAAETMTHHLDECVLCSLTVELLKRADETARLDRSFEPPPEVVENAVRIFPATTGVEWQVWAGLRRLVAGLVSSGVGEPATAGVRSLGAASRHVVYKAGQYSIDLQVDSDPDVSSVAMTGQIADSDAPDIPIGNTRVVLLSGGRLLASTGTNEFGEFSLQYKPSDDLCLLLPIEETGEYIELQLELRRELD